MFPVTRDRSMLRKLAPAGLAALGLVALVLAMPSYSFSYASAQTKAKPKYRLSVSVSGVPNTIDLTKTYTYTVKVKNTGRLKLKKVTVRYWDGRFVLRPFPSGCKYIAGPSIDDGSEVRCTLGSIKVGATRRIAFRVSYASRPELAIPGNPSQVQVIAVGSPGGKAQKKLSPKY